MSTKLTETGIQLNGTTTTEQTKVITEIDGVVLSDDTNWSTTGVVKLSSTSESLDERLSFLEENGT